MIRQTLQRFKYRVAVALFIIASLIASFGQVQLVSAATLTWTGAGDGLTFSDSDNWSTNAVPQDGDAINFSTLTSGEDYQSIHLTNDLTGVEFAGVSAANSSSGLSTTYFIDTITLQDGATITKSNTGDKYASVRFEGGTVSGLGDVTVGADANIGGVVDIAGELTSNGWAVLESGSSVGSIVSAGSLSLNGNVAVGSIHLAEGNFGVMFSGSSRTINTDFIIDAFDSERVLNHIGFGDCSVPMGGMGGGYPSPIEVKCSEYGSATFTLAGDITLNSDLIIAVAEKSTVKITGKITYNGHKIEKYTQSQGTLEVKGSAVEIPATKTSLNGDSSESVQVSNKETATLNGSRNNISVLEGGILKGTGSVGYLSNYGSVAPGNSPGKMTVRSMYNSQGELQIELLDASHYDQLIVGEEYQGSMNAVGLYSGSTLNVILYDGWSIKKGDQFTILNNMSETAIDGTFDDLDEGSQFVIEGITFSITYEGGDGNDIVLTALNAGTDPDAPDTGALRLVLANPILIAGLGLVTAGLISVVALRRRANASR